MGGGRRFAERLRGGPRQSLGESDAIAREVCDAPGRAAELWEAVESADPVVRIRAVDALEKASATRPEILQGRERQVLDDLLRSELAEVRWHVGLLTPRLRLDADGLTLASAALERLLEDSSRIAQANALEGLVALGERHPSLAARADEALARAARSPHPSVRARARRLRSGKRASPQRR